MEEGLGWMAQPPSAPRLLQPNDGGLLPLQHGPAEVEGRNSEHSAWLGRGTPRAGRPGSSKSLRTHKAFEVSHGGKPIRAAEQEGRWLVRAFPEPPTPWGHWGGAAVSLPCPLTVSQPPCPRCWQGLAPGHAEGSQPGWGRVCRDGGTPPACPDGSRDSGCTPAGSAGFPKKAADRKQEVVRGES